jgi:hypothetical protein
MKGLFFRQFGEFGGFFMYLVLGFQLNNFLLRLKMICMGAELTRLLGNKKSVQYTNKLAKFNYATCKTDEKSST